MSFLDNIQAVGQQGMSEAEAKILNEFLSAEDNIHLISKSELSEAEFISFTKLLTLTTKYNLICYRGFLVSFLQSKIPIKRKRTFELLKALKKEDKDEDDGLIGKLRKL